MERVNVTTSKPQVTVIGGGMITQIQLLPSLYQMQRDGVIGEIHVCALNAAPIRQLQDDAALAAAFPKQKFIPHPDPKKVRADESFPELYREVLTAAGAGNIAVIAVPDQMHYPVLKAALDAGQHICIVKPLVLTYAQATEIEKLAYDRGLMIGVEYHKRFDYRNMMARKSYRDGKLGVFRLGQAHLLEPYYYRDSNFQNWCTCPNSDMFTYVGCHYVDLVAFITGLKPVAVSVYGLKDKYPNGNEGFLWTDGRVIWENGACLSVANAIGYPSAAAGGNSQGMTLWCQGPKDAALIHHSDQFRGVKHHYTTIGTDPGDTLYAEPNPDYFRLIDQGQDGLTATGYGHRSVEYIVTACVKAATMKELSARQALIKEYDTQGIMATPANSSYNELVIEAGRLSIVNGGKLVEIQYGASPCVKFKE